MKTFLNIRGPNGAGKTTLAKKFVGDFDALVELTAYRDRKTGSRKIVTGILNADHNSVIVGRYTDHGGGLDTIPTFDVQHDAIRGGLALPEVDTVIAEGILVSTQIGCWKPFAEELREAGHRVVWAFLDVPLEVCFERIEQRREAHRARKSPFKRDQVEAKWHKNNSLFEELKDADWVETIRLPFGEEWETICDLLALKT